MLACRPAPTWHEPGTADRLYPLGFGDTLWGVANAYDVPGGYPAIARANHITNPNYVLAGRKLRITTRDTSLPEIPRVTPAAPVSACAMQPLATRPASLSGCVEASCVDTGRGGSVCACKAPTPAGDALLVTRPGSPPQRLAVTAADPWWFDPEAAPEPERSTRGLVAVKVQLDADTALETIVAWRTQLGDLGMSHGTALTVDDDGIAGAIFRADNFGIGSVVNAGDHCDVFATEWELTDQPGWRSVGWYLEGRRFRAENGALAPVDSPLVMRRLFTSFRPTPATVGTVRVGAPSVDLSDSHAFSRSTEPFVELSTIQTQRGTLKAARRVDGHLLVNIDGTESPIDGAGAGIRRLGDLRTGLLYPSDYAPADDRSLRGRPVEVRTYYTEWGESFSVAWVG